MCFDPLSLTLAAAALTAGGNYVQTQNNNASTQAQYNARNETAAAGVQQQQPNIVNAQNALNNTISKFSQPNQATDLGNLITQRTAAINGNITPATGTTDPTNSIKGAPQVVQSALASKLADATQFNQQQGGALAAMGATPQLFSDNQLALNDNSQNLQDISNKAKEEAAVNQIQQTSNYNNARKPPSVLGQGMSDVGTVLGLGAAAAGGPQALMSSLFSSGADPATNAVVGAANAASPAIKAGLAPKIDPTQIIPPGWLTD